MNGGFSPMPQSPNGAPSPPPSVGRSSTGMYARSEKSQSQHAGNQELVLADHYISLKRYLSATSRDGNPKPPPNKARDKLQRLTEVQFLELSTDVYDELKRREQVARRGPNAPPETAPPDYLLPEDNFHPKRNQARQKLSSLGPPRFRDLATDVFIELERRYPNFANLEMPLNASPIAMRGPSSRSGTPVNGMGGFPPRGQSHRRPSEASSVRSARSGPPMPPMMNGGYGVPPSPGLPPNGDYGRPMPKQFQSNTIVPNKSTMVEEDDEGNPMSPDQGGNMYGNGRRSMGPASEADRKLIQDYETQVRELQEKVDNMEMEMRKKNEELNNMQSGDGDKREWDETRQSLETKLAEAQELNDSLQRELDRIREEHEDETRKLREELEDVRQSGGSGPRGDGDLARENEELRQSLQEQQQITDEVRREAQEFLREMRTLSQQSGAAWERQTELERTIEEKEKEVKEWRSRYARTQTQLRTMRDSSEGVPLEQNAGKFIREKGFVEDSGLVKDLHVTKFQIAIDELLQRARDDNPERVIDSMKAVVVSVRRIAKDIDENPRNESILQEKAKLKARVSSTANNLITASKNFASSAGISPVSLLDAAASHLVAAVIELLRAAKIRTTPAGELEDDDDGTVTPVGSASFFSPRNGQSQTSSVGSAHEVLAQPTAFQGPGGAGSRISVDSSAYSSTNSPRESYANSKPTAPDPRRVEDLKFYLQDRTSIMVETIQNLVQLIRSDANINQVSGEIAMITDVVNKVVAETDSCLGGASTTVVDLVRRLGNCRDRLNEAGQRGIELDAQGSSPTSREWRMWTQTLPPIAFELARETKELVQQVDRLAAAGMNDGADDFA
ncbi:component of the polarisome [Neurospora sp. IMI 360204]|nr:component of the polarisome [Neurospora sp. IMI 360204]